MTKISENHSYSHLQKQMAGMKAVAWLTGDANMQNRIKELEEQLSEMCALPDVFNGYYANRGWIAYESMNQELMKEAVELAKAGNLDDGEERLIEYYEDTERIKYLTYSLKTRHGFQKRYELFRFAYEDFVAKRYHACVPVFLMIIDGAVDEVTKTNKGFFADATELELWNSIVGHKSGLSTLQRICSGSRKKVNTDAISIPYRNGIMHGKDINYANRYVAAKTLAMLFAVADWIVQFGDGNHVEPEPQPSKSILEQASDLFKTLSDYAQHQREIEKTKKSLDKWMARDFSQIDLKSFRVEDGTPEAKAIEFFHLLITNNYNALVGTITKHDSSQTKNKQINEIKSILQGIKIVGEPKLRGIKDCAPAISEVTLKIIAEDEDDERFPFEVCIRLIYQSSQDDASPLCRDNPNGKWYVLDINLMEISSKYWAAYFEKKRINRLSKKGNILTDKTNI